MTYALGLDIGTTYVAAAIVRNGTVEALSLDNYRVSVPSVVFASGDEMLFGEAALRRGAVQPSGLAREFKRRLGDPVPLVLDGSPYHADRLSALLTAWIFETVRQQMGGPPSSTVVTHPANWTEFQLNLYRNALRDVGLGDTTFLSEPGAAALDFAAVSPLQNGEMVLVYDLGGGTFDVALLRYTGEDFEHVIEPFGIERLGGIDFDEALFEHVLGLVPAEILADARQSAEGASALVQVRRAVVDAKEALSSDVAVDIPVVVAGFASTVRVTRRDLERMIEPMVRQTLEGIRITLSRAEIQPSDLSAVLLVGGSSRIPLIPDLVTKELGLPARIDAHPKLVVAKGAARHAAAIAATRPATTTGGSTTARSRRQRRAWAGGAAALVVVGVAAGVIGTRGGGSSDADTDDSSAATSAAGESDSTTDVSPPTASTASPVTEPGPTSTERTVETPPQRFAVSGEIATNGLPLGITVRDNELFVASTTSNELQRFAIGGAQPVPMPSLDLPDDDVERPRANDAIATDDGVYVSLHERRAVAFVDPVAGVVVPIEIPGKPLDFAVTDDGTVWVSALGDGEENAPPGLLVPIHGTEIGQPIELEYAVGPLAVADDALYFVHFSDGRVGRLDLADLGLVTVEVSGGLADIEVVGDELWVALRELDQVGVLDRQTLELIGRVDVGADPHKILLAHGSVWVTNETLPPWGPDKRPGSVSRLDPATRSPIQDPIVVGFAPINLVAGDDVVYVSNHHGPVDGDLPIEEYETTDDAEQRDRDEESTQPASVSILRAVG